MSNKPRAPLIRSQTVLLAEQTKVSSSIKEAERAVHSENEDEDFEEERKQTVDEDDEEGQEMSECFEANNKEEEKMKSNTPAWMMEADRLLARFDRKLESVMKYQSDLNDGFRLFDEKKKQFKLQGRQASPVKKVVKPNKLLGLEKLNHHIILLIITFVDHNPALIIQKLSSVSRTLRTKLACKAIWREMIVLYFGKDFYNINERKCEAAELQNPKRLFWRDAWLKFQTQFSAFSKTFKSYKAMICSRNISIPSLQKEVLAGISFFNTYITLKISAPSKASASSAPLFLKIFEDFVLREKFFLSMSYLINNEFLPIRYDAVSLAVSLFSGPIYEVFKKEFDANMKINTLKACGLAEIQHLKLLLNTGFFKNDKLVRFALDSNLNMIQVTEKNTQKMFLKSIDKERQALNNFLFQNKQINCVINLKNQLGSQSELFAMLSMKKTGEVFCVFKDLKLELTGKFSLDQVREKPKLEGILGNHKSLVEGSLTYKEFGRKVETFKAFIVVYYLLSPDDPKPPELCFGVLGVEKVAQNYILIEMLG